MQNAVNKNIQLQTKLKKSPYARAAPAACCTSPKRVKGCRPSYHSTLDLAHLQKIISWFLMVAKDER